jgi:hypothetical protein
MTDKYTSLQVCCGSKKFYNTSPKDLAELNQDSFCLKSLAGGKFKLLNFPVLFEKER